MIGQPIDFEKTTTASDGGGHDAPLATDEGLANGTPYSEYRRSAEGRRREVILVPSLDSLLGPAVDRAQRRAEGKEKPIGLPWPTIATHFGGGLWPGVHFVTAGTGVGKTALALQVSLYAALSGVPVAYLGLELDEMQLAMRLLGEQTGVPWSELYLGKAESAYLEKARAAVPMLSSLPFHPFVQRPQGWSASALADIASSMRARYPEEDGRGSRPLLFVVDFLQIIGDELDDRGRPINLDTRARVSRAAYAMRDIAIRFEGAVLAISSIARDKYGVLFDACIAAELDFDEDGTGRPTRRRVLNPDAVVGLGKESGEIEYAGDSVSVLAKVPGTWKDGASDVLFITAKGRATGPTWSPLHFTRWGYREADDGGRSTIAAMKAAADRGRTAKRAAKAFEAESKTKAAAEAKAAKVCKEDSDRRSRWDNQDQALVELLRLAPNGQLGRVQIRDQLKAKLGSLSNGDEGVIVARLGAAIERPGPEPNSNRDARPFRLVESNLPERLRRLPR